MCVVVTKEFGVVGTLRGGVPTITKSRLAKQCQNLGEYMNFEWFCIQKYLFSHT